MSKLRRIAKSFVLWKNQVLKTDKFSYDELKTKEDFAMLDLALPLIFHNYDSLISYTFFYTDSKHSALSDERKKPTIVRRRKNDKEPSINQRRRFLLFHLNDFAWMHNYITEVMLKHYPNCSIDSSNIEKYIKESPVYKAECERFTNDYFRARLLSWFIKPKINAECITHQSNFADFDELPWCDELFYNHAKSYFILDGFDNHTIDVYLEKNADIWRKTVMEKAINNNEIFLKWNSKSRNLKTPQDIAKRKDELLEIALKIKEKEYYEKHKKVIDEAGTATSAMKMSPRAVERLKKELNKGILF